MTVLARRQGGKMAFTHVVHPEELVAAIVSKRASIGEKEF